MSDDTGRVPTDEELAKIAWDAFLIYPDREDGNAVWGRDAHVREIWTKVACALRAALVPSVPPLAPGEVVTIPSVNTRDDWRTEAVLRLWPHSKATLLDVGLVFGYKGGSLQFDAAGIAALETVCRRARVALEGGK